MNGAIIRVGYGMEVDSHKCDLPSNAVTGTVYQCYECGRQSIAERTFKFRGWTTAWKNKWWKIPLSKKAKNLRTWFWLLLFEFVAWFSFLVVWRNR